VEDAASNTRLVIEGGNDEIVLQAQTTVDSEPLAHTFLRVNEPLNGRFASPEVAFRFATIVGRGEAVFFCVPDRARRARFL
jgi:hypothetical protein